MSKYVRVLPQARQVICTWAAHVQPFILGYLQNITNGEFVLRIEDTDLERSTPEATAAIIEGMEWLNLAWEHGPYYQTKRFDRYNQVIDEMIEQGLAYRCYCSKERLEELRHTQEQNKEKPRYDRHCLHDHNHAADEPHVVRFKNPTEGSVVFDDAVRGRIEISNR